MLRRLKTVSMMLFLMGLSTGAASQLLQQELTT